MVSSFALIFLAVQGLLVLTTAAPCNVQDGIVGDACSEIEQTSSLLQKHSMAKRGEEPPASTVAKNSGVKKEYLNKEYVEWLENKYDKLEEKTEELEQEKEELEEEVKEEKHEAKKEELEEEVEGERHEATFHEKHVEKGSGKVIGKANGKVIVKTSQTPPDNVKQCEDDTFGQNFCSEWCNVEAIWGNCGEHLIIGGDDRNPGGDHWCSCDGCNGCKPKCEDGKFGINFCSEWCNVASIWPQCGDHLLKGEDTRNTDNKDYWCGCSGCNGCPRVWNFTGPYSDANAK